MASMVGLTIEDFEKLPDEQALNRELVDGELVEVSGNTALHNLLRDRLLILMTPLVQASQTGTLIAEQEFDFDGNAHGPDLAFYSAAKQNLLDVHRRVQRFVPDLAIEIVSVNDTFASLARKRTRYLRCGVSEVWIIAPEEREVYIYSPSVSLACELSALISK
jgi:Uma2 family endonuclease